MMIYNKNKILLLYIIVIGAINNSISIIVSIFVSKNIKKHDTSSKPIKMLTILYKQTQND